jgi:hypothetical protein
MGMKLEVNDPSTGELMNLDAKPEKYHGLHGFRIRHENGSHFFISNRSGTWQAADGHHLDADLLINIGLALEHYDITEQIKNVKPNNG